jgi:hypothetical protein
MDKIGDILRHFRLGVENLKLSVTHFENFGERFKEIEKGDKEGASIELIKQAAFVQEFF